MPLFRKDSKLAAMIKHWMDVVKQAISYLKSQQTPVIAFDQPLFAISKQVQWNWKELYEQDFVGMMAALHIEIAAFKTLGNSILYNACAYFITFTRKVESVQKIEKVNMKKEIVLANKNLSRV